MIFLWYVEEVVEGMWRRLSTENISVCVCVCVWDIKVEERRENKQKQEEARKEGYLYLMVISDDGRVIFTTQEDSSAIYYIIYGIQFGIADQ